MDDKSSTSDKTRKKGDRPLALILDCKPALVDLAARQDAMEGIRQGLEDAANGRWRPAREALSEFRAKHGIPR
jgi:predicted transcriptional regulator